MDYNLILLGYVAVTLTLIEIGILTQINKFKGLVQGWLIGFSAPETRLKMYEEMADAVLNTLSKRMGNVAGGMKSGQIRQGTAIMQGMDPMLAGLMGALPKQYQAFAPFILPFIQQMLTKYAGQAQQSTAGSSQAGTWP